MAPSHETLSSSLQRFGLFWYPGGLVLVLAFVFSFTAAWAEYLPQLVALAPWLVGLAGLILAWRFNRTALLFGLAVLFLSDWVLRTYAVPVSTSGSALRNAVAFLLPLNLLAWALVTERGLLTPRGCLRICLILVQIGLVYLLSLGGSNGPARYLQQPFVTLAFLDGLRLGQPAVLAWTLAALGLALGYLRQPGALLSGFFWALISSLIAIVRFDPGLGSSFFMNVAAFILMISVIETSHALAYRDELTGLPGRRALNEDLLRLGRVYTLAMLDIDHFKQFNDRYGHATGDQVLKMVAGQLARVGGGGKAYRYGGEEFTIVFAGRSLEESQVHLERVRQAVADSGFALRSAPRPRRKPTKPARRTAQQVAVTISIGAAEHGAQAAAEVIKAADAKLYKAKQAGRNRVCV